MRVKEERDTFTLHFQFNNSSFDSTDISVLFLLMLIYFSLLCVSNHAADLNIVM